MNNKSLYTFWKKHVDSKFLCRIVSEEYISDIRKNGLNHKKDPFEKNKKDIFKLFNICLKLYNKGFIMMRWWGKPVDQTVVIATSKKDLNNPFIDFGPNNKKNIDYYLNLRGGALVNTVLIFTEEILMTKPHLTKPEIKFVTKMNQWAKKKHIYKNTVIFVKASSRYFESAHFRPVEGGDNIESPFGSFEHFKKTVSKKGIAYYTPYLTVKKSFYVRTIKPIPTSEINYKK